MRFSRPRPKRDLITIAPLVDIVFQLLLFFMLAGSIEVPDELPVDPPLSESLLAEETDENDVVILVASDGVVAFQGKTMPTNADLVRTATVWFAARPESSIQLKADADAEATRVIQVMELLREAGAQYLVLVTVARGAEA